MGIDWNTGRTATGTAARVLLAVIGLGILATTPAAAQEGPGQPAARPAGAPGARRMRAPVKTIWNYQAELGLTGKQVDSIKASLKSLQEKLVDKRRAIIALEKEIRAKITADAPLDKIEEDLNKSAQLNVQSRLEDIRIAREINGILTPEQAAKWKDIQKKARDERKARAPQKAPKN